MAQNETSNRGNKKYRQVQQRRMKSNKVKGVLKQVLLYGVKTHAGTVLYSSNIQYRLMRLGHFSQVIASSFILSKRAIFFLEQVNPF